jgi:hypothetical protein
MCAVAFRCDKKPSVGVEGFLSLIKGGAVARASEWPTGHEERVRGSRSPSEATATDEAGEV